MGKFSDVLEKLAERERLEDSLEALPPPITTRQQKKEEASASTPLGFAPESAEPARADDPDSLLSDDTILAETERQETDEASTIVPLDPKSETVPVRADDPEPLSDDHTIPIQAEEDKAEEGSMNVPLDSKSESVPVRADDPEPRSDDHTIPIQAEEDKAEEGSMNVPLDSKSESGAIRADDIDPLSTVDTLPLEAEQEDTDEVSTDDQPYSMPVSDPVRAGDPNIFFSDETVVLEAEQEEADEASTNVKSDSASDSEAIRLTQVWPFVAYDPAPVESKKKGNEEAETSSRDEFAPVSRIVRSVDPNLVVYHDPASVEAEIFKVLRTNILFPKDGTPPPSVMVTSALPGDGKSFIASNLAVSIAQGIEEYVLLMDCDMRRSTIHKIFGFDDNITGLSEYLSKDVPLTALLKKTVVKKLTILPGGRTPNNPSELLSSQRMKDLIEETKKRYKDRFIIVDSPPPHLTAETTALAKYVDGIVLVVRSGRTPKPLVDALIEKIGREKIIGVVLNGHQMPATERYGYGRYNLHNYEYRNDKD